MGLTEGPTGVGLTEQIDKFLNIKNNINHSLIFVKFGMNNFGPQTFN